MNKQEQRARTPIKLSLLSSICHPPARPPLASPVPFSPPRGLRALSPGHHAAKRCEIARFLMGSFRRGIDAFRLWQPSPPPLPPPPFFNRKQLSSLKLTPFPLPLSSTLPPTPQQSARPSRSRAVRSRRSASTPSSSSSASLACATSASSGACRWRCPRSDR